MSSQPLVSAIIIFFNAERYLGEAIESVLAQTCADWELLLCDDGSTDGGTAIAQRYVKQRPDKIKYLEHDGHRNRGMSATRNLGLRHARGKFVAWLDADDVWLPEKIDRQLALFSDHPEVAMVYGPLQFWHSWTESSEDADRDFIRPPRLATNQLLRPPALLLSFLRDETTIPSGVMVRKDALTEVGGFEESFRDEYEDVVVHAKLCLLWPVYASRECLYRYRQHDQSCAADTRRLGRQQSRRLRFLKWLSEYLNAQGYQGTEVWKAVQEQLAQYRTIRYAVSSWVWAVYPAARRLAKLALPNSLYLRIRANWYARKCGGAS